MLSSFADEWATFSDISGQDDIFDDYFRIFPWHLINAQSTGLDFGCGNGRWAARVAPRVLQLVCVDVPSVLPTAKKNLAPFKSVLCLDAIPPYVTFDFAYSLGVLHHIEDTQRALNNIANALRPSAPFLIYLYYKPNHHRLLWCLSDLVRRVICQLPHPLRLAITTTIATFVYKPLSYTTILPYYRNKSFYIMRNDAYDRFSTKLEKRFTRDEVQSMLERAGFHSIEFSDRRPYWCAVGIKA